MGARKISIAVDEWYHVFNRGILKNVIFHDERDYVRFLFLALYLQSPEYFTSPGRHVTRFLQSGRFGIYPDKLQKIILTRQVELGAFCVMPNHFHLLVFEKAEGGIARYMQRILIAYTKYYHAKYKTNGHIFQGQYQAVHAESNNQLIYLTAYIHRNPREMARWKDREKSYPWSSYQNYLTKNMWGELLKPELILDQFETLQEYEHWVKTSGAKDKQFDDLHLD